MTPAKAEHDTKLDVWTGVGLRAALVLGVAALALAGFRELVWQIAVHRNGGVAALLVAGVRRVVRS